MKKVIARRLRLQIRKVLDEIWGLGGKVRVRVMWSSARRGCWRLRGAYGMVRFSGWDNEGRAKFVVVFNQRVVESDGLMKGVCAHEALHIAYKYFAERGEMEKFWGGIVEYLGRAVELLGGVYGSAEEFVVSVLEPLVTLALFPPPAEMREGEKWILVMPTEDVI